MHPLTEFPFGRPWKLWHLAMSKVSQSSLENIHLMESCKVYSHNYLLHKIKWSIICNSLFNISCLFAWNFDGIPHKIRILITESVNIYIYLSIYKVS